jgi:hypothetical protein
MTVLYRLEREYLRPLKNPWQSFAQMASAASENPTEQIDNNIKSGHLRRYVPRRAQ